MEIQRRFTVGVLSDAKVGDLVKVSYGQGGIDLGVVYGANEQFTQVIVLRTSSSVSVAPYADQFKVDHLCVNYGSEWIVEVLDSFESTRGYFSVEYGAIAFLGDEAILTLAPYAHAPRPPSLYFDISNLQYRLGSPHDAYMVKRWRLWANQKHKDEVEAEPLLEFEASPSVAR